MGTSLYSTLVTTYGDDLFADRTGSRSFGLATVDNADSDPIAGLTYAADSRSEEETGIVELRRALTGPVERNFTITDTGRGLVTPLTGANAVAFSTIPLVGDAHQWGDHLTTQGWLSQSTAAPDYVSHYTSALRWAQGLSVDRWTKMDELRTVAKSLAISPLPRTKAALYDAVTAHPELPRAHPNIWPGWFARGDILVLRAETGPVAAALAHLRDAAQSGHLGVGSTRSVFSSGELFFYDVRDESFELQYAREEAFDVYDRQMAPIPGVLAGLRSEGWCVYFLGKPAELNPGNRKSEVSLHYWLNASPPRWGGAQVSNWFTLDELTARSFAAAS